jgi:hypothetical protein
LQSASHFVVQSAVVGTEVHCVEQWSLQQAPQDASQSVDDSVPASVVVVDDEHDELQWELQRELQSVLQSTVGGLAWHFVEQSELQLVVQLASADAVHCALHCCSSLAAHACSQLGGAHCVVQSFCVTNEHCALASMSMFPHALTFALASRDAKSAKPAKAAANSEACVPQGR